MHSIGLIILACGLSAVAAGSSITEMIKPQFLAMMINRSKNQTFALNPKAVITDFHGNSVSRQLKRPKSALPNITSVFAGQEQDKVLKSDPSIVVSKLSNVRLDWCTSEPIVQKVREDGCLPKNIINKFCYGQCNSFYIPQNLATRRGKKKKRREEIEETPAFRSCGFCKPKKTSWSQVTLHCPGQVPPMKRRRVLKIKECQCIALDSAL